MAWRRALRDQRAAFAPDLVIARGGGLGFEVHQGLARHRQAGPWIAHFHDPYPLSVYEHQGIPAPWVACQGGSQRRVGSPS